MMMMMMMMMMCVQCVLSMIVPEHDQVYFAYFVPYSNERHLDLIAKCASNPLCDVRSVGLSLGKA
jgi:hypothetical protein